MTERVYFLLIMSFCFHMIVFFIVMHTVLHNLSKILFIFSEIRGNSISNRNIVHILS